MNVLSRVVAALSAVLIVPALVEACSCAPVSNQCGAVMAADVAIVATVERIEPPIVRDGRRQSRVLLSGIRPLRGAIAESVVYTDVDSSCRYPFVAGESYVIADKRDASGALVVGTCGPTLRLADAEPLLDHLRAVASGRDDGGVIWGRVWDVTALRADAVTPLPGATVVVTRRGDTATYETQADDAGNFVVRQLKPGAYVMLARPPRGVSGLRFAEAPDAVIATSRNCARVDLYFNQKHN
ncbi:MAG: carboxypeptidase regulatory-like domain-containing protein [Acidobacteria bacterium]|nr:carboxypeptidase regulatory-like domain-containing protein [Acidobacteriota bacterium]